MANQIGEYPHSLASWSHTHTHTHARAYTRPDSLKEGTLAGLRVLLLCISLGTWRWSHTEKKNPSSAFVLAAYGQVGPPTMCSWSRLFHSRSSKRGYVDKWRRSVTSGVKVMGEGLFRLRRVLVSGVIWAQINNTQCMDWFPKHSSINCTYTQPL